MTHGLFEVIGRREYRGHPTGTMFEARMDAALQRALDRGDIKYVAEVEPDLEPGSYSLPRDWPPERLMQHEHQGRRKAPLLVEGGGK